MNTKRMKLKAVLSATLVAVMVMASLQGCGKEENLIEQEDSKANSSLKIRKAQKSEGFINFVSAYNQYQKETFSAINSMNAEERDHFIKNMNDDNVMKAFIEKYNLTESNINLQKQIQKLKKNTNFEELTYNEKVDLLTKGQFSNPVKKNISVRLKTTGQETIGEEPCAKKYKEDLTDLNIETTVQLIGCACAAELLPVACVCAAAVIANHYRKLAKIEQAYEDCLISKSK